MPERAGRTTGKLKHRNSVFMFKSAAMIMIDFSYCMQSEKEDPRVFFNTILTEHAKGGFKDPVALRERITAIRNSLKER